MKSTTARTRPAALASPIQTLAHVYRATEAAINARPDAAPVSYVLWSAVDAVRALILALPAASLADALAQVQTIEILNQVDDPADTGRREALIANGLASIHAAIEAHLSPAQVAETAWPLSGPVLTTADLDNAPKAIRQENPE